MTSDPDKILLFDHTDAQVAIFDRIFNRLQDLNLAASSNRPFAPLTHEEMQEVVNVLRHWKWTDRQRTGYEVMFEAAVFYSKRAIFKNGEESRCVVFTPSDTEAKRGK